MTLDATGERIIPNRQHYQVRIFFIDLVETLGSQMIANSTPDSQQFKQTKCDLKTTLTYPKNKSR
jgi:hypothetical protein